jgi:hypothetical protein
VGTNLARLGRIEEARKVEEALVSRVLANGRGASAFDWACGGPVGPGGVARFSGLIQLPGPAARWEEGSLSLRHRNHPEAQAFVAANVRGVAEAVGRPNVRGAAEP